MTSLKAWIAGLSLAASILLAQSSGHRVTLPVIAQDSHGQPVTDLKNDELRVTDEGKQQTIVAFNAPSAQPPKPTTLILVDFLNMDFSNRGVLSDQLIRSLEGLENADSLYLYILTFEANLYPVHPLPANPEPASDGPWTRQIRTLLGQAVDKTAGLKSIPERDPGFQSAATFNALDAVATGLSGMPGHKNIVWITRGASNHICCPYSCADVTFHGRSGDYLAGQHESSSFCPNVGIDYKPFLRHFSAQLAQDDTSVYIVEQTSGASTNTSTGGPRDTLIEVAGLTAGRLYHNDAPDKVINQALLDARSAYRIAFDPANLDGKYHKLKVTCTRKGVQIQTRQGYYAEK